MDTPPLALCDAATFWPSLSWTDFQALPRKEETVVVVPVVGFADWGLGLPLDLEEVVLCSVLREASAARGGVPLLVLPPVRFVTGPMPGCVFAVNPSVACSLITEIVLSVRSAGFAKVVLLNSSPWNEEPCDATARDLRIDHRVQMFCISMSGLGLDLHPIRSQSRRTVQAVYSTITGIQPDPMGNTPSAPGGARDHVGKPAEISEAPGLDEGIKAFGSASAQLASLLVEIFNRPALAAEGRIGAPRTP